MAVFSTNLVIYKYTDFEQTFVLEDSQTNSLKDLTDFTGTCRMQRTLNLGSLTGFTVTFTNRLNGKIRISLSNTQTGEIEEGKYFYELVLTDPNNITERVIEGTVIVKHPVTWPSPPPLTPFDAQVP
tara:strand:+ start:703 stop:1083 length:381 start_codon:yes stop_codon:yes gene_type:complete